MTNANGEAGPRDAAAAAPVGGSAAHAADQRPTEPDAPSVDVERGSHRGPWSGGRPWAGSPWARQDRAGRRRARGPRPAWWPADEPWPPAQRARRWRRFGCLVGVPVAAGALGLVSFGLSVVGHLASAPGPSGTAIRVAALLVALGVIVGFLRTARSIARAGGVLDSLVDQAARVEAGDYAARVDLRRPVPGAVRQLVRGFNTMAARLETDDQRRRALLADVSHELRTPLAVIQGNVEAILDGVHPADQAHLGAILEESRVLARLVDDLRTSAQSEAGSLSLHREPTDLPILVSDVATSFTARAEAAGVDLLTRIDAAVPLLDIDPIRIREVVANLVANAIRHTPDGGRVELTVGAVPEALAAGSIAPSASPRAHAKAAPEVEARRDEVEVKVRDTGSGIAPELLPHVFDRFVRGDRSDGSGLGLSIARSLVELHGGTIVAEIPAVGGTEIRFRLPVEPPAGA